MSEVINLTHISTLWGKMKEYVTNALSDMETKTHAGNTYQPKFSVSASDNGKVLTVVNGQLAWVKVASIYSGSAAPSSTLGEDGDIYIQA